MRFLINQPRGLGDILFCEPLVRKLKETADEIIWPVNDEFIWIKDYIPYINFVKRSEYHDIDYDVDYFQIKGSGAEEITLIPLRFANPKVRNLSSKFDCSDQLHTMMDKYRLMGYPEDLWKQLTWQRNTARENELFDKLVKSDSYILRNSFWSGGRIEMPVSGNIVEMSNFENYTLLDWAKIIENATEIHTVSTSNLFVIEALQIKADKICIYKREPLENNFDGIKEFVNSKFILVNE